MNCNSNNSNICHASAKTQTPGKDWCDLSNEERLTLVNDTIFTNSKFQREVLMAVEAKQDGQIIIRLLEYISADKRGTLLLDLEYFLKVSIDQGLVVWLEPLGDRNSLRNLRGIEIEVKS